MNIDPKRLETLGPAERVLQALLTYADHSYHNRPGFVFPDKTTAVGVKWEPVTHKVEPVTGPVAKGVVVDPATPMHTVVYKVAKVGNKQTSTRLGVLGEDGQIRENGRVLGRYQPAGLFPEVAAWVYRQIADVWKLDNEFAARWASHAFGEEHRDLKVALTAFMLVQSRSGEPVRESDAPGAPVLFHDEDHREVGEAMLLLQRKDRDLNPKLVLRVRDLLRLPEVAAINRELGFGRSAKNPTLGRWPRAVEKWLRYREQNPNVLQGLVKAGFRTTVMALVRAVGYKPETDRFFQILRWKQLQGADGRRTVAIGAAVAEAASWEGLTEAEICEQIIKTKPSHKRLTSLLPRKMTVTRAIMAASIEAGILSDTDLIMLTPTLEDLGLLTASPAVAAIKARWEMALRNADSQRSRNIASRVRREETKAKLEGAADNVVAKAVEEVMRGLRICVAVDVSGSQSVAIEKSKAYLTKLLGGFPLDKLHVCTFSTIANEIKIPHASAAGVEAAFKGKAAGGGTNHSAAVIHLAEKVKKSLTPDEDVLLIWVGDQQQYGTCAESIRAAGLNPVAFGFLYVPGSDGTTQRHVEGAADNLGIPCFRIAEEAFNDPYAIPRTLRNLIASTPVGVGKVAPTTKRVTLVEQILKVELLQRPAWATPLPPAAPAAAPSVTP